MRGAVGAVCQAYLAHFGIEVIGYVRSIGDVEAALPVELSYAERYRLVEESDVRCPDAEAAGGCAVSSGRPCRTRTRSAACSRS